MTTNSSDKLSKEALLARLHNEMEATCRRLEDNSLKALKWEIQQKDKIKGLVTNWRIGSVDLVELVAFLEEQNPFLPENSDGK